MGCPTGQVEKFFPPMTKPICMPASQAQAIDEANAKVKGKDGSKASNESTGLPQWVLDILGNADKIGAGIGAATGKTPTAPVVVAPPTSELPKTGVPQWVWFAGAGLVILVVFTLIRRK